jgi:hypothetical protein
VPGGQSASLAGQTGLDSKASTWLNRVMAQTETQTLHPSYARALRQQLRREEQDAKAFAASASVYQTLVEMFDARLVGVLSDLEREVMTAERNRYAASVAEFRDSMTIATRDAREIRKQLGA